MNYTVVSQNTETITVRFPTSVRSRYQRVMQSDDDTGFDLDFREVSADEVPPSVMKRINETKKLPLSSFTTQKKKLSIHDFLHSRGALPRDKTIDEIREMALYDKYKV